MSAEVLQRAFASTATVLSGVSLDQMDMATPCVSWSVRDLVNHIVGGPTFFAITAETGQAPSRGDAPGFAAGDYISVFDQEAQRAVTAFSADGAMDKTMNLPFGAMPGRVFVFIAAIDTFTHGWDLTKAAGQSTDLDPTLAAELLDVARVSLPDTMRGPESNAPFGPQVAVAEAVSPPDKLAAFMGRTP